MNSSDTIQQTLRNLLTVLADTGPSSNETIADVYMSRFQPITPADVSRLMALAAALGYVERVRFEQETYSGAELAALSSALPDGECDRERFEFMIAAAVPGQLVARDVDLLFGLAENARRGRKSRHDDHLTVLCADCGAFLSLRSIVRRFEQQAAYQCDFWGFDRFVLLEHFDGGEEHLLRNANARVLGLLEWLYSQSEGNLDRRNRGAGTWKRSGHQTSTAEGGEV